MTLLYRIQFRRLGSFAPILLPESIEGFKNVGGTMRPKTFRFAFSLRVEAEEAAHQLRNGDNPSWRGGTFEVTDPVPAGSGVPGTKGVYDVF